MVNPVLELGLDPSADDSQRDIFYNLLHKCDPTMIGGTPGPGTGSAGTFVVAGYDGVVGFDPGTFVEQSQSQYAAQMPVGGHASSRTFLRNSNRMVSFTLEFIAQSGPDPRMDQVRWPVALLESLCYPSVATSQAYAVAPPLIYLHLSTLCAIRGFVHSFAVEWGGGWGSVPQYVGWSPERASVSLSIIGVGFGGGGYDQGRYADFASVLRA